MLLYSSSNADWTLSPCTDAAVAGDQPSCRAKPRIKHEHAVWLAAGAPPAAADPVTSQHPQERTSTAERMHLALVASRQRVATAGGGGVMSVAHPMSSVCTLPVRARAFARTAGGDRCTHAGCAFILGPKAMRSVCAWPTRALPGSVERRSKNIRHAPPWETICAPQTGTRPRDGRFSVFARRRRIASAEQPKTEDAATRTQTAARQPTCTYPRLQVTLLVLLGMARVVASLPARSV